MVKVHPEEIYISKLLANVSVSEIMNASFAKIGEEGSLSEVQLKFIAHRTFYVVVVNENDQLAGLISQKYLFKTQSPRRMISPNIQLETGIIADDDSYYNKETLDSFRLSNVMDKSPATLSPEDSVSQAVLVMKKRNIGCIIIVNKNNIVQGILTHQEIVNYLAAFLK